MASETKEVSRSALALKCERYKVKGGSATVLPVRKGDEVKVVNLEGRQAAEVIAFESDGSGRSQPQLLQALGASQLPSYPTAPSSILASLSRSTDESARSLLAGLAAQGVQLKDQLTCFSLFGANSIAGEAVSFGPVGSDLILLVGAPGPAVMNVDDTTVDRACATDLHVFITRGRNAFGKNKDHDAEPPPPIAQPRLDIRISKATAQVYSVNAGEYIQVIDISGGQCSDFLAFNSKRLAEGAELDIDATVTRTLNGSAYPTPGLFFSKFFDRDFNAMIEVVRDTVGRHDTFALACTAKYYEDMGYPGHANCTDNFNQVLATAGIKARATWPAINFFYNTKIDANNQIFMDEPWTRPGDYVLLRALQDLVCASSACPDDIDPANAWDPSAIQVRIYPSTSDISPGVVCRVTPDSDPTLTRRSGFHSRTAALTRSFAEYRGFWLPTCFTGLGPIEEYYACRQKAIVIDLSALRKFEILGHDAETLLQACVTRDLRKLAVGQIVYTALCYDNGCMLDDATVFRLGPANFRLVCGDEYCGNWLRLQAEKRGLKQVWVKSSTDQLHNLAVQGPNSKAILKQILWTPTAKPTIDELGWFKFTIGRFGGSQGVPVIVSRTGYTGELGYEIWCHPTHAEKVWDAIWSAGEPHGLTPLGLSGLDMLRIESGLIFYGYEFDDQIDPFEAGIGFAVPQNKEDDFIGKKSLSLRKAAPLRALVGLELTDSNEPAVHGDCIHLGRQQVGVVTSGTKSPLLKKNLALARVSVEYSAIGTELEVGKLDGHRKRIKAVVVRFPFYDPEKKKPRGILDN